MLTDLKIFSVSLAASATCVEDTSTTLEITCLYNSNTNLLVFKSSAPTILGIIEVEKFLLPGSSLSGEYAK